MDDVLVVGGAFVAVAAFMLVYVTIPAVRKWRRTAGAKPIKTGIGLRGGHQRVVIEGKAVKLKDSVTSSMAEANCLAYSYKVEQRNSGSNSGNWATIQEEGEAAPFRVDDNTGRVNVNPGENPYLDLSQRQMEEFGWTDANIGPVRTGKHRLRYAESRLDPADFCCVVGYATGTSDGFTIEPGYEGDRVIITDVSYRKLRRKMLKMAILVALFSLVFGVVGIAALLDYFGVVDIPMDD